MVLQLILLVHIRLVLELYNYIAVLDEELRYWTGRYGIASYVLQLFSHMVYYSSKLAYLIGAIVLYVLFIRSFHSI